MNLNHFYNNIIKIKLKQKIPCKYLLLKLIDGVKSNDPSNDCYRM